MASDEMIRVDRLLRQMAAKRLGEAREAGELVGRILKGARIRWVERESGERVASERGAKRSARAISTSKRSGAASGVASVLSIDLCEHEVDHLRDACALITGVDGWELDHERLIGLLSFAVLRGGPLWAKRSAPDG